MSEMRCRGDVGAPPSAETFAGDQGPEGIQDHCSNQDIAPAWLGRRYGLRVAVARVIAAEAGFGSIAA
jgi:hypothetical protein